MKKVLTILAIGVLALFISSQINASETGSLADAIKHAEMAKTHGDDEKKLLHHVEMSLKHVEEIDREALGKVNAEEEKLINAAIMHLQEAISHAEMDHADAASKSIDKALKEMRQFSAK